VQPLFIATERFDPSNEAWPKYIAWSGLKQLDELVSLDSALCPTVLPKTKPEYWDHIVSEDFMLDYFTDLDFLNKEVAGIPAKNLLCVFRNPSEDPGAYVPNGFKFVGYGLVEKDGGISALTNCKGFPNAFSNGELSQKGLLSTHSRAREVQEVLLQKYANDPHALCNLWAVYRNG
jgi:hypothetical protein